MKIDPIFESQSHHLSPPELAGTAAVCRVNANRVAPNPKHRCLSLVPVAESNQPHRKSHYLSDICIKIVLQPAPSGHLRNCSLGDFRIGFNYQFRSLALG